MVSCFCVCVFFFLNNMHRKNSFSMHLRGIAVNVTGRPSVEDDF